MPQTMVQMQSTFHISHISERPSRTDLLDCFTMIMHVHVQYVYYSRHDSQLVCKKMMPSI